MRSLQNVIPLPPTDPAVAVSVGGEVLFRKVAGQPPEISHDGGPWQFLATGSSGAAAIVVPTIAALEAYDVTGVENGNRASVLTLRDTWTLVPTLPAPPPNGITIVAAADGRTWIRNEEPSPWWLLPDEWWIDPVAGDDEARGTISTQPLRSLEEWSRRVGMLPITQPTVINLMGDLGSVAICCNTTGGSVAPGGYVVLRGQLEQVATSTIAAATPHDNTPGAPAVGEFTATVDVSAWIGLFVRAIDGAAAGAMGVAAVSGSTPDEIRCGPFRDDFGDDASFPAPTDSVEFLRPTRVAEINVSGPCVVLFEQLSCGVIAAHATGVIWNRCLVEDVVWVGASNGGALFQACGFLAGAELAVNTTEISLWGVTFGPGALVFAADGYTYCYQNSTQIMFGQIPSRATPLVRLADAIVFGTFCFADVDASTTCLEVQRGGFCAIRGFLWGEQAAGGPGDAIRVGARAQLTYQSAAFVPEFSPNDTVRIGGTADVLSSLPQTEAANFAAIVEHA